MTTTDDALYRAALERHRDGLESARLVASQDRDKVVLAIAGGSLTVSVAFLERIAANVTAWQVGLLATGWFFEIAAMDAILYSLHFSDRALAHERQRVDSILNADHKD